MKFALVIFALFSLSGCEVNPIGTKAKLQALQRAQRHGRHRVIVKHHRQKQYVDSVEVTPEWMRQYKSLEEVHGNYTIPDDAHSEVLPDGKVRVSHGQLQHYNDLLRAPIPEVPTPITGGTPPP